MRRKWLRLLSIPKTLFVNFRYFPFSIALKIPFFVRYNATIRINGSIVFTGPVKTGMIHLGFNEHPCCNRYDKTMLRIDKGGVLSVNGRLYMGNGCKICVHSGGTLATGDYVRSTGSTAIECFKSITIGNNVLFSWDCLVMDSDSHKIFSPEGDLINADNPISIGNDVWIGSRSVILKGSKIPLNVVVASNTVTSGGGVFRENSIIAGIPAKSVKSIGSWKS